MFLLSLPVTVAMSCFYCRCLKLWSCHVFTVVANNGGHVIFFTVVANKWPCYVFTVVANNGGHVMFLLSLSVTVAMLCFHCRCQ